MRRDSIQRFASLATSAAAALLMEAPRSLFGQASFPNLSIEPAGNQTYSISWPESAADYLLEETGVLLPSAPWQPFPTPPILNNGFYSVTVLNSPDSRFFRLTLSAPIEPFRISNHSPSQGASGVGVLVRPQVFFTRAVDPSTLSQDSFFATGPAGMLSGSIVPANDGTFAWLFLDQPMPGSSRIRMNIVGDAIRDLAGEQLDADGDGQPGGTRVIEFNTVSLAGLPGTALTGVVLGTGPDMLPFTADDFDPGPDGESGTEDDLFLEPIAGAEVFLLGRDSVRVVTGVDGRFLLSNVPSGHVQVAVNGQTASSPPSGMYYPEIVMDTVIQAGFTNTIMPGEPEFFLPPLPLGILQNVENGAGTVLGGDAMSAPGLTDEQRARIRIEVPANSMIASDGQPLPDAQIGFSLVPVDFVRSMLPPGVMQGDDSFNITFQSPGVERFTSPIPVTLPNLNGLAPGTVLEFLSFDHNAGRLVNEGTGTVSADGLVITTDPDTGITHPGWHTFAPPSTRLQDPCDPRAARNVVVEPVVRTSGLRNYLFVDDDGGFTLTFTNAASPIDPTKDPCDPVNLPATPLIVAIDVQGNNGRFEFLEGLHRQVLWLQPGEHWEIPVRLKKRLNPLEVSVARENLFFGAKVVVVGFRLGNAGEKLIEEELFIYRFLDIGDGNHTDGRIAFERALVDGPDGVMQSKPFQERLPSVARPLYRMMSTQASQAANFLVVTNSPALPSQVIFDPTDPAGLQLEFLEVVTPNLDVAGNLLLVGNGVGPQKVLFARDDFAVACRQLVDAFPPLANTSDVVDLFPADSDADGMRSDEAGFETKVTELYQGVRAAMDGGPTSLFGEVAPEVSQALQVLDSNAGEGVLLNFNIAAPKSGVSIPRAGYGSDTTGMPVYLGPVSKLVVSVGAGSFDPGVEVRLLFEQSPDGLAWTTFHELLITAATTGFTRDFRFNAAVTPQSFYRARTIHMGAAGGATYGVTNSGHSNLCGDPDVGGCAWWADFHKDDFGLYDTNTPLRTIGGLITNHFRSTLEQRWLFDSLSNRSFSDDEGGRDETVVLNLDLEAAGLQGTPPAHLQSLFATNIAQSIAHEVGHDLGAIHLRDAYRKYIAGDVMGVIPGLPPRTGFKKMGPLIRMVLGLPISQSEAFRLWDYYKRYDRFETYRHNVTLTRPAHDHELDLLPLPVLTVFDRLPEIGEGSAEEVFQVAFPPVFADEAGGDVATVDLFLFNDGGLALTVVEARLQDGAQGFEIAAFDAVPAVMDPIDLDAPNMGIEAATRVLTLRFDPLTSGLATDVLRISSDSLDGEPILIPLEGVGVAPEADLVLSLENNNLGGAPAGGPPALMTPFAAITNLGASDLTIERITVDSSPPGLFTVSGLPAVPTPTAPLVLPPGAGLTFDLAFSPAGPGLQIGLLEIVSSDPDTPLLQNTVVGTGLTSLGETFEVDYGDDYVMVETPTLPGNTMIRARSTPEGDVSFFLPPNIPFHMVIFDPVSGLVAHLYGLSADSGQTTPVITPVFAASVEPDVDGDGLPADIELTLGTSDTNTDTDGDGTSDLDAILAGIDPLGGAGPAGVVSAVSLDGAAKALSVRGRLDEPRRQAAYVATGEAGLAIVDVTNAREPIILSQLDLPGDSVDLAFEPSRGLVVLASGGPGLNFVDVADPGTPRWLGNLPLRSTAGFFGPLDHVEVTDRFAFATVSGAGEIHAVDLDTWAVARLTRLDLFSVFYDLARRGSQLLAQVGVNFRSFDIEGETLVTSGSVAVPFFGNITFGEDLGLVVAASRSGAFEAGGFSTIDISDPADFRLISGPDNNNRVPRTDVALNGSRLALIVGETSESGPSLDIFELSDPSETGLFLARLLLLGAPGAVVPAQGAALVAAGDAGLLTVNYQTLDPGSVPPQFHQVTIYTENGLLLSEAPVLERTPLRIWAEATDDVDVRSLEVFLDGRLVASDSAPRAEMVARAPASVSGSDNRHTLQIRATDTGGNRTVSEPFEFVVAADDSPPAIIKIEPPVNGMVPTRNARVEVVFSKPMDPATLTAAFGTVYGGAGEPIAPSRLELLTDGRGARFHFDNLPEGNYEFVVQGEVRDRAGNPLLAPPSTHPFRAVEGTILWTGLVSTNWNEPGNWEPMRVPVSNDVVVVDGPVAGTVFINVAAEVDRIIMTRGVLTVGNSTLTLANESQLWNVRLFNGLVANGPTTLHGFGAGNSSINAPNGLFNRGTFRYDLRFNTTWSGQVENHGVMVKRGDGGMQLSEATFINFGEFLLERGSVTPAGGTVSFVNPGLVRKLTDSSISLTVPFHHQGRLDVEEGFLDLRGGGVHENAEIQVHAGARCSLSVGNFSFQGRNQASGDGILQMTFASVEVAEAASWLLGLSGNSFLASGGTLTVNGSVTNIGAASWTAGNWDLPGGLHNAGTFAISGGPRNLTGVLNNSGLVTHSGTTLNLTGAVMNNLADAIYEMTGGSLANSSGSNVFHNSGIVRKSGTGTASINIPLHNNARIEGLAGILNLGSAGSFHTNAVLELAAGSRLSLVSGTHLFSGRSLARGEGRFESRFSANVLTVAEDGDLTLDLNGQGFNLGAGTFNASGPVTNVGLAEWTGGTLNAPAGFHNQGTLNISGTTRTLTGELENSGAVLHSSATVTLSDATIQNRPGAVYETQSGTLSSSGAQNRFLNSGIWRKTGSGTATVGAPFLNQDQIDIQSSLANFAGGFTQTAGTLSLNGGNLRGTPFVDLQGGILTGAGTVTATLTNGATLHLGGEGAAGTLQITGSYVQTSDGVLQVELGGTEIGTFDRLLISSAATLDGTLNISAIDPFSPASGHAFEILTFNSRAGDFATTNGLVQGTVTLVPVYAPRNLTLTAP